MVKNKLSQKENDLKYIQRRIKYIEKMGVDVSHLPKLTKRHSQAKITDLRLHLEKNTKYRFTKIKDSQGKSFTTTIDMKTRATNEIARQTKNMKSIRENGKTFFINSKGIKIEKNEAIRGFIIRANQNKQIELENKLIQENPAYAKAREGIDNIQKSMGTGIGALKKSLPKYDIDEVSVGEQKAIEKYGYKNGDSNLLHKRMKDINLDSLARIQQTFGKDSDIYKRLSELSVEDLYAFVDIEGENFYRNAYGSGDKNNTASENREIARDELNKMLDEYLEEIKNGSVKKDMNLNGRN